MTRRAGATAALTAALLTATGACSIPPPQGSNEAIQQRYQRERAVHWDMTTPRTAQQLGVQPGQTAAAFNRAGGPYWSYRVVLPGGQVFTTPGYGHFIRVEPDEPQGSVPQSNSEVLINTRAAGLQAAIDAVRAAVPVLGLDQQRFDDWAAEALDNPLSPTDLVNVRVFPGSMFDYLLTEAEIRRVNDRDDVAINWSFIWLAKPPATVPAATR